MSTLYLSEIRTYDQTESTARPRLYIPEGSLRQFFSKAKSVILSPPMEAQMMGPIGSLDEEGLDIPPGVSDMLKAGSNTNGRNNLMKIDIVLPDQYMSYLKAHPISASWGKASSGMFSVSIASIVRNHDDEAVAIDFIPKFAERIGVGAPVSSCVEIVIEYKGGFLRAYYVRPKF